MLFQHFFQPVSIPKNGPCFLRKFLCTLCEISIGHNYTNMATVEHASSLRLLNGRIPKVYPYLMAKCDELLDYIEDEKWGDRIPGGWNG